MGQVKFYQVLLPLQFIHGTRLLTYCYLLLSEILHHCKICALYPTILFHRANHTFSTRYKFE